MAVHTRSVIASHLILTGYAFWLPNDIRGSGSVDLHDDKFAALGPIHHGRKPESEQPTRQQLKDFYTQADDLLKFPRIWFNDAMRQAIARAAEEVIRREGYTCYACAVLSNHLHLAIRRHRDDAQMMLQKLTEATQAALRALPQFGAQHPVWANRPYKRFLYTPEDVRRIVRYIRGNPIKEGLPEQRWPFVLEYDNWPLHKRGR